VTQAEEAAPGDGALLPPRAEWDGTHRALLEAALVRFGQRGFHGVSVREIAQAAGVRASSMYAHLASKEQLLFELMLLGHEEHQAAVRRALLESGPEPADQAVAMIRAHVRFHATYAVLGRVCNREMAALSPASRERVLAVRRQSEQLFMDVVERGVQLGEFDVPDTWLAAAAALAPGLRVAEWWDDQLPYRVEEVALAYGEFALRLLTGPGEGARP
jgi:AcrR family transcriptional regulator